jgi:ATP-dependent Clp protease ATP-binding subunit ClpB
MGTIRKMLSENGITLDYTPSAKRLIAKLGYDPLFGARPVKRVIQREVVNELSKRILASGVNQDKPILIDAEGERLTYSN